LIASANRDEREFVDPDEFRWNRAPERHLAFGHGLHFCIGSHVARLEGRVLLEELLRRVPAFDLDEDRAVRPPSDFQIGYVKLPIIPL
jgi:cytochrome P450